MQDILRKIPEDQQRGKSWLFSIILIGYISVLMIFGSAGEVDTDSILGMNPVKLLAIQGVISVFMFIGIPLIFIRILLRIDAFEFFPGISWLTAASTFLIALCSIVVMSAIGEWNMSLDFGDSDFAQWARRSEDQLKVLTEHFTHFSSPLHFILAFLVIAIIPAIGEELLFRGLIQNNLSRAFNNHHLAIWVTGVIFAAIHLQFFGFAPRMFLGVLFGYLYLWSGKLTVAVLAHLVNNGLAIIMIYLVQQGTIKMSPEEMDQAAPWPLILLFGALGAYLLISFRKKCMAQDA